MSDSKPTKDIREAYFEKWLRAALGTENISTDFSGLPGYQPDNNGFIIDCKKLGHEPDNVATKLNALLREKLGCALSPASCLNDRVIVRTAFLEQIARVQDMAGLAGVGKAQLFNGTTPRITPGNRTQALTRREPPAPKKTVENYEIEEMLRAISSAAGKVCVRETVDGHDTISVPVPAERVSSTAKLMAGLFSGPDRGPDYEAIIPSKEQSRISLKIGMLTPEIIRRFEAQSELLKRVCGADPSPSPA